VSGTPVLDAVESSGISEIARVTNVRFLFVDSWTDDPTGRAVGWMRLLCIFSTTIRSDGDYPSEGIPPVSRFLLYTSGWPLMPSRLILCLFAYCTPRGGLTDDPDSPLKGCTYRRLGTMLESPKLLLLSHLLSSVPSLQLRRAVFGLAPLPLRVAVCHTSSQSPIRPCSPSVPPSPPRLPKTLRRGPLSPWMTRSPIRPNYRRRRQLTSYSHEESLSWR